MEKHLVLAVLAMLGHLLAMLCFRSALLTLALTFGLSLDFVPYSDSNSALFLRQPLVGRYLVGTFPLLKLQVCSQDLG